MPKPSHQQLLQHARELVQDAGQWAVVTQVNTGEILGYALPSRSQPGVMHLVSIDPPHCDCTYAKLHGLTHRRIGHGGNHEPCAHILAVQYLSEEQLNVTTP